MSRISIAMPSRLSFSTQIEVRVTDLNYGRHLGNDALVSMLHEARVRYLRSLGHDEGNVAGTTIIQADLAVVYRAEAFGGDVLRFEVGVAALARASCDFVYRITRVGDERLVAEAKTCIVFLDPGTRRPTSRPEVTDRWITG